MTTHSDALPVQELINRLPKYFTCSCVSARNSGKSVLCEELVKKLIDQDRIDICLVMSGSAGLNDDYTDILPSKMIMPFSESMLDSLWKSQRATPAKERKHVLVVIDDALGTPEAFRSLTLQRIFSQGRHLYISCIIISQHTSYLLTTIIKSNSDVILWSRLNRQQLKSLWESTTNIDFKKFMAISETLGGANYQFMLLDNYSKAKSKDYTDFLTFIRAESPK